jgi:ABC-type Fe3+ transport system substrate-binding protein
MTIGRFLGALVVALVSLPALAQDWQAGAGADWQKLLADARKEGTVVLVGPPSIGKPLSEGFKRDTGIDVEFLGIVGAPAVTRMTREYKAQQVTLDVVFSGAVSMALLEYMQPIKPMFKLPGVTEAKNWINGAPKFADNAGTYIFYAGEAIFGWPVVNTDMVKPGDIKSWNDLLDPKYKGKIAIYDPRVPGPGVATSTYIADALGLDYIKKLYVDQQPKFSRDGRQLVEWLARGLNPIVVGFGQSDIDDFQKAGIKNLDVLYDIQGTALPIIAGFYPHVPKLAPHPNAAAVFMNWLASKPGQDANAHAQVQWSERVDADPTGLPPQLRPKPGVKYIDQYGEDFVTQKRDKLTEDIRKLVGEDK